MIYFKITKQFPKFIYMKISRCKCNLTFSKNRIFFFEKSYFSFLMLLNQIDLTGYQMIKFYFKITKQFPNIIYMKIAGLINFSIFFPF